MYRIGEETTRAPARALVRSIAGFLIAAASSGFIWLGSPLAAVILVFWALLLFGPVLAWPLVGGRLIGLLLAIAGAVIFVLILGTLGREGSTLAGLVTAFGISALFLLASALLAFPQSVVSWVRGYVRP